MTSVDAPQQEDHEPILGHVVIPLLKGVVYRDNDEKRWQQLTALQLQIRDYVSVLGLELYLDEAEGYAFLRSPGATGAAESVIADGELPRLVSRRPLTYGVSLLLALLRKRLAEFDATSGDTKLVLSQSDIVDLVTVFQPSSTNEAKQVDRVERDIGTIVDLGFLRAMQSKAKRNGEPTYEVRRILKAFVDAQWMSEFNERLDEYRQRGNLGQDVGDVEPGDENE
jgi:hypothetical protein